MNIGRRPFLTGLVTSGLALSTRSLYGTVLSSSSSRPTGAPQSVAAIVSGSGFDSAFLAGIQSASNSPTFQPPVFSRIDNLNDVMTLASAAISSGRYGIVAGLVDDASAVLLTDLARHARMSTVWLGHHTIAPSGITTRHLITTANLDRTYHSFSQSNPIAWASQLGETLVSDCNRAAVTAVNDAPAPQDVTETQHLVSFSLRIEGV